MLGDEHVDVQIPGAARLLGPVGEGDRAAERVLQARVLEGGMQSEQPLGERHDRGSRGKRSAGPGR